MSSTSSTSSKLWKVVVNCSAFSSFLQELGKEDVVWVPMLSCMTVQAVLLKPRPVKFVSMQRKLKSAIDIKPWTYEEFKLVKSSYIQVKYHSAKYSELYCKYVMKKDSETTTNSDETTTNSYENYN